MGYAVELNLETVAAEAIRNLFVQTDSLMARIGAAPHVSLAVFDTVDSSKLIDVVRLFAEDTPPFRIRFSSIGIFPGEDNVVFLARIIHGF